MWTWLSGGVQVYHLRPAATGLQLKCRPHPGLQINWDPVKNKQEKQQGKYSRAEQGKTGQMGY